MNDIRQAFEDYYISMFGWNPNLHFIGNEYNVKLASMNAEKASHINDCFKVWKYRQAEVDRLKAEIGNYKAIMNNSEGGH